MKLQHLVHLVVAVTLSFIGIIAAAPAAQAAPPNDIGLGKTSGGSVLVGGEAEWSLTASNPAGGVEQYNLSFTDTLPTGVTYVPGSTTPAMFGNPQVITITDDNATPGDTSDDTTHQVLLWENISDLTPGSTATLSYRTDVDAGLYPIGAVVQNTSAAFVSSDPRIVPDFDSNGEPVGGPSITSATDNASTTVAAIKVTKSEPSPEGELLRGLGDHQTVYTLKVTNNSVDATSDLLVIDYLPAGIEFLGCGNTSIIGGPEYPGANNAVAPVTGCVEPQLVETVTDPSGHPAGIYTKVTWSIGNLDPSGTYTLNYAAAIPQRANTTTWAGGEPAADSLQQAANLVNNTGPSTRETGSEQSMTNYVDVSGIFVGDPVAATSQETVTVEDLRMRKSVSPTLFSQGQIATYTLTVDTGEYADADQLVITDLLPNGLCPLGTADPTYIPIPECDPSQGAVPTNAEITGVEPQADGSYRLTITPDSQALAHNDTVVITYRALMRTRYGSDGSNDPTAADDGFTNTATITGTTTMRDDVNAPAPNGIETVNDESSATILSTSPIISKLRQANANPMQCSDEATAYATNPAGEPYNLGDRVCFLLSVNFPSGVDTKGAQLTDFLPTNFAFESYNVITGVDLVESFTQPAALTGGYMTWYLGSGDPRVVPRGSVFQVVVSATVAKPAPATASNPNSLDKENLAKFRWMNSAGESLSLRDSSVVTLAPQPTVAIFKGVQSINATSIDTGTIPVNVDGRTVRGGDQVTFRIDVNNQAQAGAINGRNLSAPDVWDVLPAGITCASISAISDAGTCFDAATPGRPALTSGDDTSSIIRWQLPESFSVAPGEYGKVTYIMTVPATVSVSTIYTNTAAVASYRTATNIDDGTPVTVQSFPQANIDAGVPVGNQQVPAASDASNVVTPNATVVKAVTSAATTNNSATQAVVGEAVEYKVGVRIPAQTTVFNAALTDPMPAGVTFVGPATALYSTTGVAPATLPLPAGVSIDPATGTLTFAPSGYTNATATDQLFEVTIPALVNTALANVHGKLLVNIATFNSTTEAGTTPITPRTASTILTVVAPAPIVSKAASPSSNVTSGQSVAYTLAVRNIAFRPTMHDSWAVDCLPAGMTFTTYSASTPVGVATLAATPGTGTNGCAVGFTRLAWNVGSIVGGATVTLRYTAAVNSNPVGQQVYRNTVTWTGSTLNDAKLDPSDPNNSNERSFSVAAFVNVTAGGATVTKTADQTQLTPGATGTYTVNVNLPSNTVFYDAAIIDTLPTGMSLVSTESITCTRVDASACPITGGTLTASGANVGWTAGDMAADTQVRTITVNYTARMTTLASNVAGILRTNTAKFSWMLTDKTMPANAAGTWDTSSTVTTANTTNTTVIEPRMRVDKSVDDTTVEPGQVFTYTVVASNNVLANYLSPAYNVTITDQVPAGIVVDQSTLAAAPGGTVAMVGNTITWTVPGPLAPNDALTFTYRASLAGSATLTPGVRTNTATVTGYDSLPSAGLHYTGPDDTAAVTPQFPHLTPTKTVASGPAYLGQPKMWTITVTSDGIVTARNVAVVDTLPENWFYNLGTATVTVAGSPAQQIDPVITSGGGNVAVLTWADIGDIPATGANTATITLMATPLTQAATTPGAGSTVPHTNTVTVTGQDATGATGNAAGPYSAPQATASAHIDSADVRITKTNEFNPVAGRSTVWTLTVSSVGPDTAVGPFTVVDDLPTTVDLGPVSATGTGWTCSVNTPTVTCARTNPADTLASGASFPIITITGQIPAGASGGSMLRNDASVTSGTHDPSLGNNATNVTGTTIIESDFGVTKAASGDMVAGEDYTWTVNVTNHGPSDQAAIDLTLTDPMPAGLRLVSADGGDDWDCRTDVDTELSCTYEGAPLAVGQAAPQIVVVTHVGSGVVGDVTNTVTINADPTDPNPDNDTASASATARPVADIAIVKVHLGTFTAGAEGTYRFTVTNFGPSDALNVRVTDTLPAGLTFLGSTGTGSCSASGQDVTCSLGDINAGASPEFEVTVAIDPALTGDIVNTAGVDSVTPDPNVGNNSSTDSTRTDLSSDLGIQKSHSGDATAGQNLDFSLVVTNHGSSDNPGPMTVTDTIPDGMSYVSAGGSGWNCGHDGREVTCTRDSALDAGGSDTITLTVHVAPDAGPAELVNYANVASTTPDPEPGNNTDTDQVTVNDSVEISVTKTADDTTVLAGEEVIYTLTVTNAGPSDADNVVIYDPLAPGLSIVSVDGNGWTCDNTDDGIVNCLGGTLAAGDSHAVVVVTEVGSGVPDGAVIVNEVTVSTSSSGDDTGDNTAEETIAVSTAADLSVAKSHDGNAVAGEQVTFDLTVTNDGPSDAQAPITITDTLPVGLTFVGATGDWTCLPSGQEIECTLNGSDPLLAGLDAPSLHLITQVDTDLAPTDATLTNTGIVDSPTADPNPDNNTATDEVTVEFDANLAIVKTHTGTARIGDHLDFTLVVANDGPSTGRGIAVTDMLPDGLTYVSATGTGWQCTADAQNVTCDLDGTLLAGSTAEPITVTVLVGPAAYPTVDNTAVVEAATPDSDPADSTSTDTVPVPAQADIAIAKSHTPEPMQVGQQATYTLTVTNDGPTENPGPITVTDVLPDGLTYSSSSSECQAAGQSVTCTVGLLRVGEAISVTATVEVEPGAYPQVTNTATVTSATEDVDPGNNTASDTATVAPLHRLTLDKTLSGSAIGQADWQLVVTNLGPNEAPNGATVIDDLPGTLSYSGYTGDGWTCAAAGRTVTCDYAGQIPVDGTATVILHTLVAEGVTEVANTATVVDGWGDDATSTASGRVPTVVDELASTGGVALALAAFGLLLAGLGAALTRARRPETVRAKA